MATVVFRGSRSELRNILGNLGPQLSGSASDTGGMAREFATALGVGLLSEVKDAYIEKARGGTDDMGIKWDPLSPVTIANRRSGGTPGERKRQQIVARETKKQAERFGGDKKRAKIAAQRLATKQTGMTKLQTLGNRDVEILRDTGILFNSISVGEISGGTYVRPNEDGSEFHVFEAEPGLCVVGTRVFYAATHQKGRANIPARPFLPDDNNPIPEAWWNSMLDLATGFLVEALVRTLRSAR